jgi:hypothetical protein
VLRLLLRSALKVERRRTLLCTRAVGSANAQRTTTAGSCKDEKANGKMKKRKRKRKRTTKQDEEKEQKQTKLN